MASLISAISSYVSRMTSGERRLTNRQEKKLDHDYLLGYDVPFGPRYSHPDFCILHYLRDLMITKVKDLQASTFLVAEKIELFCITTSKAANRLTFALKTKE